MRDFILVKMKDITQDWLKAKEDASIVMNEQAQDLSEGVEQNLVSSVEDFHQFLFSHFDEAISAFDPHSQRHMQILFSLCLESWVDQDLLAWKSFRLVLTPIGEATFSNIAAAA